MLVLPFGGARCRVGVYRMERDEESCALALYEPLLNVCDVPSAATPCCDRGVLVYGLWGTVRQQEKKGPSREV